MFVYDENCDFGAKNRDFHVCKYELFHPNTANNDGVRLNIKQRAAVLEYQKSFYFTSKLIKF